MAYDRPLYHQSSPSLLAQYTTRLLLGFVGSLTVVLLGFHVSLPSSSEDIGWLPRESERIPLSQVQQEDTPEDTENTTVDKEGAPPPTRHTPPVADVPAGQSEGDSTPDANEQTDASSEEEKSRDVQSIATLSAEDTQPSLVGGRGSLYLEIRYPPKARKQGIEGVVLLQFTVDANGNARRINVTQSLHPLCDSAAVRGLRAVNFRPAIRNGEPIPVRMSLPVRFQLRSSNENATSSTRGPSSGSD